MDIPVLFFSFTYCRIILAVVIVVKPLARILMSVVVLMGVQVLPLAAQWVNGPEYNPAQGHATMDMDQYLILQKASLWMCFSGLAVESSGVYLFVYEACNVLEGQKFQPFKGKALTGLICVTAGVALLTGSYILAKRVNSGERLIYRIQDRQMMLPYSMLTVGPTEHGLGMSYRF